MSNSVQQQVKIGFIGQGWIGKNYADNFEERGFDIVRYSAEISHAKNKELIKDCDIVFIAVPTPSTPEGFDDSIVRETIKVVGRGKIAVIKSTVLPGATASIQKENPSIFVLHSPEFLREASAREDVDHPDSNIVGIPVDDPRWRKAAEKVLEVLPDAPYKKICRSEESELAKYGRNLFLYWKVIFTNLFYDVARYHKIDWSVVAENIGADPRIGMSHMQPIHHQKHLGGTPGRGAGGHCFIKDFAAFEQHYRRVVGNPFGVEVLEALREKNLHLLLTSGKDLDLLESVYGDLIQDTRFTKRV